MESLQFSRYLSHLPVDYTARSEDQILKGHLLWDERFQAPRPSIILVPEWWGISPYLFIRAEQLARLGYLVMLIDLYGEGRFTDNPEQAGEWSGAVRGSLAYTRFMAAISVLENSDRALKGRVSAIGYCFGGSVAIDMAIADAPLQAVISFHGCLSGFAPIDKAIPIKLRVFHGDQDPMSPTNDVAEFKRRMSKHCADFRFIEYPGASHAFSNPLADAVSKQSGLSGIAYHPYADLDSWTQATAALAEVYYSA